MNLFSSIFTAAKDPSQNTIGVANRLLTSKSKDEANKNVIIGATVGGVAFLVILAVAVFFLIRSYKRRPRSPPSAIFTGQAPRSASRTAVGDEGSRTKSSFFGLGSLKHEPELIAEPWVPPNGDGGEGITVRSWTPNAQSEQAFLSPTGTSSTLPYQPTSSPSASTHQTNRMSVGSAFTSYTSQPQTYGGHPQMATVSEYFPPSVASQPRALPTSPIYQQVPTQSPQSISTQFQQPPPGASAPLSPSLHSPSSQHAPRPLPRPPGHQGSM